MSDLPALSRRDVRNSTNDRYYERGENYTICHSKYWRIG